MTRVSSGQRKRLVSRTGLPRRPLRELSRKPAFIPAPAHLVMNGRQLRAFLPRIISIPQC